MINASNRPARHGFAALSAVTIFLTVGAAQLRAQVIPDFTRPPSRDVRQVSLSTDGGIVAARLEATRAVQIRVTVKYFAVDDETRAKVYKQLGPDKVNTSVSQVTRNLPQRSMVEGVSRTECSKAIGTASHISTSVLDKSATDEIVKMMAASAGSSSVRTQSILLLEGKDAEYSDISQRPFVVGVERLGSGLNPIVQVLDEGTTIRMSASLSESPLDAPVRVQLKCELGWRKILSVDTKKVFGIEEEATTVQVPTNMIKTVLAVEELAMGETLLVDPYLTKSITLQSETGVPVLRNLPYVGRTFKSVQFENADHNIMVLLQPTVE